MKKFFLAAAVLSAATISGPASAQSRSEPGVVVSSSDLDLRTAVGRATLHARLDAAVRKVCPPFGGGFYETVARQRCISETTAEVRRKARVVIARANRARDTDEGLASR
jgi:UrcA family protein